MWSGSKRPRILAPRFSTFLLTPRARIFLPDEERWATIEETRLADGLNAGTPGASAEEDAGRAGIEEEYKQVLERLETEPDMLEAHLDAGGAQAGEVVGGDDLLPRQHLRVRQRAADVLHGRPGRATVQTRPEALLARERYRDEQKELDTKARELEKETDLAHRKTDRFDLGEVFLEVALVVTSITLLSGRRLFWYFGLLMGTIGLIVTASGGLLH